MRKLFCALGFAALVPFLTAVPGSAQTVHIDSSLGARCLVADCSTLEFYLSLPGQSTVDALHLTSHGGVWGFQRLIAALDDAHNEISVTWLTGSHPDQFSLWFSANASPEPIRLIVEMQQWGTKAQIGDGSLTYRGRGFDQQEHHVSFYGQVVPEPAPLLLILAALVPLWIAARRRRNLLALEAA